MSALRLLAVLAVAAALLLAGLQVAASLELRPIRSVRVAGDLRQMPHGALEKAIEGELRGGFFEVDVDAVRDAALRLPWVKTVSVRRVWPDSLHVAVIEREAAARWRDGGLVDEDGTLFHPQLGEDGFESLPLLAGPPGSHAQALASYREFQRALAPMGARIRELTLTRRGAWRVLLEGGVRLVLGRDPRPRQLEQFARAFRAELADRADRIDRIDLRYTHGFAVRWKEDAAGGGEG